MAGTDTPSLAGRRILLVEDEYFIAEDMVRVFKECAAEIVGPASNVEDALELLDATDALDGAVLDVNLQGEMAYPIADALKARGVPFVFATGYDASSIAPPYRDVVRCEKPVSPKTIAQALFG